MPRKPKVTVPAVVKKEPSELWEFARPILLDFAKWLILVSVVAAAAIVERILVASNFIDAAEMHILRAIHFDTIIPLSIVLGVTLVIRTLIVAYLTLRNAVNNSNAERQDKI
jgi:hypothetical protein